MKRELPPIDRFDHLFIAPRDFDASIVFYRDILGWTVLTTWNEGGKERGAVLSGGGIRLVIAEPHAAPDGSQAHGVGGGRPKVHLDIHDVDDRFVKIPKGDHVVVEPERTHWGTRWFVLRDPDGNLIAFEELHGRG